MAPAALQPTLFGLFADGPFGRLGSFDEQPGREKATFRGAPEFYGVALAPRGWLLDTNVVSELRKGPRANANVRSWAEAVPPVACYLSVVSLAEIRFGIGRVADPGFRAELEAWLNDGVRIWFGDRILDLDEAALLAWRRFAAVGQQAGVTLHNPWAETRR